MTTKYDAIIIGLGAMGSAAAYQLARKGAVVLGIDRFSPPHKQGSSHGDTRIIRQAIGEGVEYTPLVLRSYELWDEIQQATGKPVLTITGGLIMTGAAGSMRHGSSFLEQTVASAHQYNIPHSILDAGQIAERFPQFKLRGSEQGYFEEKAGFLRPELCIEAQLELAQRHAAHLAFNEKVVRFTPTKDEVIVQTTRGTYIASKAILSAGPWISQFLGEKLRRNFKVYRQVLYWFDVGGSIEQFEMPDFPIWIWEFGANAGDILYGFPAIDGPHGGVKLATEQYAATADPDTVSRQVSPQEIQTMYQRYVQPNFVGLGKRCVKASACLYTVTPDHHFVIDVHPDYPHVIIASPCSGHGFKHSAAIGEVLAELAIEGKSRLDISKFSLARFNIA